MTVTGSLWQIVQSLPQPVVEDKSSDPGPAPEPTPSFQPPATEACQAVWIMPAEPVRRLQPAKQAVYEMLESQVLVQES